MTDKETRKRERERARVSGGMAEVYLARPLTHDCNSPLEEAEPTGYYRTEHGQRAQPPCEFARACSRLYNQERRALAKATSAEAEVADDGQDDDEGVVDERRWGIYKIGFVGRPEFYVGLADDVWTRINQHLRKSSNPAIRALLDDGARPQFEILLDGIKNLERARGAEEFAIKTGKFGKPEHCLNRQHNPG